MIVLAFPYENLKKGLSTSQEISPLSDLPISPITNIIVIIRSHNVFKQVGKCATQIYSI